MNKVVCFKEEINSTKATTSENCPGLVLMKMVSVAQKLSMIEEQRQEQSFLFQQ
jgi:hypothetical protein